MGLFYMDQYYLMLVIPAALIALWAQIKVKSTFNKYNQFKTSRGNTAAMVARQILDRNGLQNVAIERVAGTLSDHYDPRQNVIRLSDTVYNSTSVGAIGVAAHEVGHAVQYATNYAPIKIRAALIPVTNIGSSIALPLAIIGIAMGSQLLTGVGIILFSAVVIFQLVTLPVEFNASSRAIKTLDEDMLLDGEELAGAKKVLSAAALTYVAALIVAIANLLRLILLRNRNRD
ncbi:MAG: zinc metallopeptidase [Oscillospiraceae bacterium]